MRVIIDECVPHIVKKRLPDRSIKTVQEMGWSGIKNGELLKLVEANFDLLSHPIRTSGISKTLRADS